MKHFLKINTNLFLVLIIILPLSCCSQKKKVLDDSTHIIEVEVGNSFQIELPSHPGTGYTWQIKGKIDESFLKLLKQEYRELGDESLDVPGMDLFQFEALKKGETIFVLWYIRQWKKDNETNPNIRTEIYTVKIS